MAGLCDLVKGGSQALQSASASGIVNNLINVANVFAAADVAVRIGSGGQVGAGDLPGLLDVKGIPCYSENLEDTIYVTPAQWYGNGMKCDGLRDPNREKIKEKIDEIDRRREALEKIKNKGFAFPPEGFPNVDSEALEALNNALGKVPNNFGSPGGEGKNSVEFSEAGILELTFHSSYRWGWQGESTVSYESKTQYPIDKGDRIEHQVNLVYSTTHFFYNYSVSRYLVKGGSRALIEQPVSMGWNIGLAPDATPSNPKTKTYIGGEFDNYSSRFISTESSSNASSFYFPPITDTPSYLKKPPEEPCDMGCSCGDISNLLRQQKRTNDNLEKLIQEIHKAVAAANFISPYSMQPERMIEGVGKQLYGAGAGRTGTVRANNLIDVVNALISAHYHRSGLQRFPAKVPSTLIPTPGIPGNPMIDLDDLSMFLKWTFEQNNAALGKYPMEFEKVDDDKSKKVEIYNIEHALAEIMGSVWKIQEDADLAVQWNIRSATEASKAGNAALKSLHAILQLIKASGFIPDRGTEEVNCTFNPDPLAGKIQTPEEQLTPTKQYIEVANINDPRTIMQLLGNINYHVQVAAASVRGDVSVNKQGGIDRLPGDQIKQDKKESKADEKVWEEWLKLQKQATTNVPKEDLPPDYQKPEIKEIKNKP